VLVLVQILQGIGIIL